MNAILNHWGSVWLEVFGLAVIQDTIFLACVVLALYILKNASAGTKYAIALIGLAKLFIPPLISVPGSTWMSQTGIAASIIFIDPVAGAGATGTTSTVLSPVGLLFLLWIALASLFILIPLVATLRLRRRLKTARRIDLRNPDYQIKQAGVRVFLSENVSMPLTTGIFGKKIYVPLLWKNWNAECQRLILHHEIAHIRRRDGFVQTLQMLAQALFFFHPLVWLLSRHMNEYREMACDDASVASRHGYPVEYSRHLVNIAEELVHEQSGCFSVSALIRQKQELLNRVKYQIKEDGMKKIPKVAVASVAAVLLLLIIPLSLSCNRDAPTEKPQQIEGAAATDDGEMPVFVKHDTPPKPVGGYAAIQQNLAYPEIARRAGIEGRVMVWAKIGTDGNVQITRIKQSLGPNGCDEAAVNAIKAVMWKPAEKDGDPVDVWVAVPVEFRLGAVGAAK